jgi:hypothetical protein
MLRLKILVSFVALLFALPSAYAANRDAKERIARRACLNGDPVKGVQILTDLFIATNDPTYVYNQGRCWEQNNRYEEAIGRFREYLRIATTQDKAALASAENHIADCEALLRKNGWVADQPAQSPVPTPLPATPPPPIAPTSQPPVATIYRVPPSTSPSAGSGLRIVGIVVLAVGGAALVTGLALNLKANNMVGALSNHYDPSTESSSKDYKILSQISYGAGGALVAGGVLLYYLGVRAGNQMTVTPSVANGTAGAVLTGAF